MKRIILASILLVSCVIMPRPAHAASQTPAPLALGVSPAINELVVERGKPAAMRITVTNVTNESMPVRALTERLVPLEPIDPGHSALFNASDWLHIDQPDFILQPKQGRDVRITVTPPPNAEPGGHYSTVYFTPLSQLDPQKGSTLYLGSKVGTLLLLVVKGDIIQKASITALDAPLVAQQGPATLSVNLHNSGNVHLTPHGHIMIVDMWGREVRRLPLPPTLLLPKTQKSIPLQWDTRGQFGMFRAQAIVTYGSAQITLASPTRAFLAGPWLYAGATIIALTLIGILIWKTKGRWRRAINALRQSK